jgi:CSLREA domain-containing protein
MSRRFVGAMAAGAVMLAFAWSSPAWAETFTVNSTADPGTGGCDAAECTLREAVTSANDRAGADDIVFELGRSATITLSSELPRIVDPEGLTVDGGRTPPSP